MVLGIVEVSRYGAAISVSSAVLVACCAVGSLVAGLYALYLATRKCPNQCGAWWLVVISGIAASLASVTDAIGDTFVALMWMMWLAILIGVSIFLCSCCQSKKRSSGSGHQHHGGNKNNECGNGECSGCCCCPSNGGGNQHRKHHQSSSSSSVSASGNSNFDLKYKPATFKEGSVTSSSTGSN